MEISFYFLVQYMEVILLLYFLLQLLQILVSIVR